MPRCTTRSATASFQAELSEATFRARLAVTSDAHRQLESGFEALLNQINEVCMQLLSRR